MICIKTGNNIELVNKELEDLKNFDYTTILEDCHPEQLIKQCKGLVDNYADTTAIHFIFTYNITAIQAIYYFSRILNKVKPDLIWYDFDSWYHTEDLDMVFSNLVKPVEELFDGTWERRIK